VDCLPPAFWTGHQVAFLGALSVHAHREGRAAMATHRHGEVRENGADGLNASAATSVAVKERWYNARNADIKCICEGGGEACSADPTDHPGTSQRETRRFGNNLIHWRGEAIVSARISWNLYMNIVRPTFLGSSRGFRCFLVSLLVVLRVVSTQYLPLLHPKSFTIVSPFTLSFFTLHCHSLTV
jgi:hypothetical protein